MGKKRRIEEISSVNIMVVNDLYSDSIFQSQAFLSTAKDEVTFILDTGCKGAHICKDPALLLEELLANHHVDDGNTARQRKSPFYSKRKG
jgi:hypothetical protein